MRKFFYIAAALVLSAPAAFCYGTTYVSHNGADSASCGINVAPCYSLAAALINTDTGGTVKVLDANAVAPSGITISRAVTIDGSGLAVIENIFSSGSPAILVNANCTLRNLVIQVTSGDGIAVSGNGVIVHVENVQIQGAPASFSNGIHVTASGVLLIADGIAIDGAATGVNVTGANGAVAASDLKISSSTSAAISLASGTATLRDALLRGTGAAGSSVGLRVSGGAIVSADHCEASANATGILVDSSSGSSVLRLGNSTIAGNATGLSSVSSGQIISLRTNVIGGNQSDGTPPLSASLK